MTIGEYKKKVRNLFESGEASEEAWEELADIVLVASEDGNTPIIDEEVGE